MLLTVEQNTMFLWASSDANIKYCLVNVMRVEKEIVKLWDLADPVYLYPDGID